MGQIQSLEEALAFLRRRLKPILILTLVGMVLALMAAKARVSMYESSAVLQVETPSVAQEGSNPGADAALLLQSIEQDLTTRGALLAVVERHGLFADQAGISDDRKAYLLRMALTFRPIAANSAAPFGQSQPISAVIISVQWDDPETAARIANDFAQGVLDHSAAGTMDRARDTAAFYQAEAARLAKDIARAEADLTTFQNDNADALPEIAASRREELLGLETDLRGVDGDLATQAGEIAALEATGSQRTTALRDLESRRAALAGLQATRDGLAARRAELMDGLARAPGVEAEITSLRRRIDQLQDQYETALTEATQSEKAFALAENQQTERFALLERALAPQDSITGGRRKIAVAGTLAALIAAVAACFIWEEIFVVLRSGAQMERQLGVRPIVSIPDLAAPRRFGLRAALARIEGDQPRPILGLPRLIVMAAGGTAALLVLAALLG